ncbi:MAG: ribose 5-phosphate isomerase B [Candidatus Paceibacterota bacterium]|jgi:ribose 5-phosphate isomerase B|nr:ribose 5-phosphate isomerase B [Candidatus Paceibacterota bacterium]MDD3548358.1 ribose 5-phosphate isomerase B [Candidatus Paceibacterota bacterium]MDD4998882.1 ribose 5-phosphate isomerase B [Candidatus Paceibacterota bacterium]MDD5545115.1 ribose 5-phosphate isomerase B [Candidatus Paceibacterota bacterium]
MLYLGADHRGYYLKEAIKEFLKSRKVEFEDLGNAQYDKDDDYPDYAELLAKKVLKNEKENKGILICGTGVGMSIVANKFKGIRAGLCLSGYLAKRAKEEDDINVLCLAADITDEKTSQTIIKEWLKTSFLSEKRHQRRLEKIKKVEEEN